MAHPKKQTTKSKRNMRRSHHALDSQASQACEKCKQAVQPHHACANCGTYKGREVKAVQAS